jgi:signal transduction histidine kinase
MIGFVTSAIFAVIISGMMKCIYQRKNRVLATISFFIIVLLFVFPFKSYADSKTKTIVIFFSLHANLPAYQNLLEGFTTTFSEEYHQPYNLLIEYLDIGRFTDDKYAKYIIEQYNEKFKDTKIDLLITVGPGVIPVLEKYGLDALKKSPTISIVLDSLNADMGNLKVENVVKLKLKFRFGQSIQSDCNLFPTYKNIYIISGCAPTDKYFTSLVRSGIGSVEKSHHVTFITGMSLDSILQILNKIPAHSIVVVPTFLSDNKGIQFSTPEVIGLLAANTNAPVFPLFDSFIKREGGVGGYIFSFYAAGKKAAMMAKEVLEGKPANKINVQDDDFYLNIYDWRVLKKWGMLGSTALPSNSIYYFKEPNFINEYKWYIFAGILFLIIETLLILFLYKLNTRQKAVLKQKTEAEELYRLLVREERLMMMVELTASLSHELSQPLTAILYNTQACLRYLKSGNASESQIEELLLKVIKDDKRAGGLISSVRSLMKLETRAKEQVNLSPIIQETVALFDPEAARQHIRMIVQHKDDSVDVLADKIQLQQVLLNLLYNAANAMENAEQGNRVISISQRTEKGSVTISVKDTGPGIGDEVKGTLFKPFVTSRKSGFGIGLAVSRNIIENHDGEIWAENCQEGGAEFSFRLKIADHE